MITFFILFAVLFFFAPNVLFGIVAFSTILTFAVVSSVKRFVLFILEGVFAIGLLTATVIALPFIWVARRFTK